MTNIHAKAKLYDTCEYIIRQEHHVIPKMSFKPEIDLKTQQNSLRAKLKELLNMPEKKTKPLPIIEYTDSSDPDFNEIRFMVETEPEFYIPAHLWLPKGRTSGVPLIICLQGHSEGMHVSMEREAYPSKKRKASSGDRDFCVQAIRQGYAALAIEQRGFGELAPAMKIDWANSCHHLAWSAILMGKTLLGDRVHDIRMMIDAIQAGFPCIDPQRIGIMGNSGGGTSSYYASCLDDRICAVMAASCFCTLTDSWGSIPHCGCSYIPGMLNYMDLPDLAMLIAPRPLILVNGMKDPINPFEKVLSAYAKVQEIYRIAGVSDNCQLVAGNEGHRFYAADAWPVFQKYMPAVPVQTHSY